MTTTAPGWATQLISDMSDMGRAPQPVKPGASESFELPDDVYFQYAYVTEDGTVRPDPEGEATVTNLWYGEVSEVRGPAYRQDEFAVVPDDLARGTVARLRLQSRSLGGEARRASLYTPVGYDASELPLVVVQDGVSFMRVGRLAALLEALLERGEVEPARLLMIEPNDRLKDYAYNEAYLDFVLTELIPEVTRSHPTAPRRVWLGASLGAQASAHLFARSLEEAAGGPRGTSPRAAAEVAGDAVVALSGAFLGAPGDADHYRSERSWLLEWLDDQPAAGRWYLDVGSLEWLEDVNRRVASTLGEQGVEHHLTVRSAGHNWVAWRDALPNALRFALR